MEGAEHRRLLTALPLHELRADKRTLCAQPVRVEAQSSPEIEQRSAGYSRRDDSGRRASRRTYRSADLPVDGVVLHEMGLQPQRHLWHVQLAGCYREDEGFGGVHLVADVVPVEQAECARR
jgi:hypothetical protein